MICPMILKDSNSMDRLVYGTEKGYLVFRSMPMLKQVKKLQISVQYPVLSVVVSPDRRFLLVGCGDNGLNVVTEPYVVGAAGVNNNSNMSTNSSSMNSARVVVTTSNQQ